MEEQRKPTRWGLWLVVGLVLLLAAYPLSYPAVNRMVAARYLPPTVFQAYEPITQTLPYWPKSVRGVYMWYWRLWSPPGPKF